jgi:hypothetical protein
MNDRVSDSVLDAYGLRQPAFAVGDRVLTKKGPGTIRFVYQTPVNYRRDLTYRVDVQGRRASGIFYERELTRIQGRPEP